jgi:peptidoglycan endopeptidase LytE
MDLRKLFPYVASACVCLAASVSAFAQTEETRPRVFNHLAGNNRLADERMVDKEQPFVVSEASAEEIKVARIPAANRSNFNFQHLISAAIDERLGTRYRWGGTGPSGYDCSGFVWSIFQAAGIDFERGSARSLWARFEEPEDEEKYRFGTLVFFSNLAHVGMVADERGFYHASRHHGVIYSPFNEYWLKRLDGFRKVPVVLDAE